MSNVHGLIVAAPSTAKRFCREGNSWALRNARARYGLTEPKDKNLRIERMSGCLVIVIATVRKIGSKAFAAWQDADAILSSLHDCDFGVLKSSSYYSRFLEANQAIAKRLKELIEDPNVMNSFAGEALESYIHHAKSSETYDWLVALAQHDSRPSIRYTSAYALNSTETKTRIKELTPILDEPPVNTWNLHCAILSGCERSWISQSTVEYLKSFDNLFLQQELASWLARG